MIDDLKRIETMMQDHIDHEIIANVGYKGEAQKAADLLIGDLIKTLSERLYDNERECVDRIRKTYTDAVKDRWYHG